VSQDKINAPDGVKRCTWCYLLQLTHLKVFITWSRLKYYSQFV